MTTISKRDAALLVASIRRANVGGHAAAARTGGDYTSAVYGFLGGLEAVLQMFLLQHGCTEAADALPAAMNDTPTAAEVAARNAEFSRLVRPSAGATP